MAERRSIDSALGICLLIITSPVLFSVSTALFSGFVSDDEEYRTVVVFRNDDLEPGHHDDRRRAVDQVFIDENVPVTNAVIPTQDGESIASAEAFCRDLEERQRTHPGLFEYSLHGYLHEPNERGVPRTSGTEPTVRSEFGGLPEAEQRQRIREGKRIMTDCLGTEPRSFVPPYATYDDATVSALAAEDVPVVAGGGWFTDTYYGETEPFETDSVVHVPEDHGFVSDWDAESFYEREALRAPFDDAYANSEVYVHGLHYWTFGSDARLDRLRSFIRYVKQHDDVLFLTVGEFADAYRDGRLTQDGNGWSYTPADDTPVYDTKR